MPLAACCLALLSLGADAPAHLRVATFNIRELSRAKLDKVDENGAGADVQLRHAAQILQRVRPDVVLINEIDFDAERRRNAALFHDRYLKVSQDGQPPLDYPHIFFEPVNTGEPTGLDLDHDGRNDGPADAHGFGKYPGQYGMAVLSRYPLARDAARTFRTLLWKDVPGNLLPDGSDGKPAWYGPDEAAVLRLSSKSHWDVPVTIGGRILHLLCAHPTPPVFDGEEDRNGRRNFDEVRFWRDYLTGGAAAGYIVDDQGRAGPLEANAAFVILGDLNADPLRDPATHGQPAIAQLLEHPRVHDPAPTSPGALGRNRPGPPYFLERKTCDFGRIDYVLPSRELTVSGGGVFWPADDDVLQSLVNGKDAASDHRLVWADLAFADR